MGRYYGFSIYFAWWDWRIGFSREALYEGDPEIMFKALKEGHNTEKVGYWYHANFPMLRIQWSKNLRKAKEGKE